MFESLLAEGGHLRDAGDGRAGHAGAVPRLRALARPPARGPDHPVGLGGLDRPPRGAAPWARRQPARPAARVRRRRGRRRTAQWSPHRRPVRRTALAATRGRPAGGRSVGRGASGVREGSADARRRAGRQARPGARSGRCPRRERPLRQLAEPWHPSSNPYAGTRGDRARRVRWRRRCSPIRRGRPASSRSTCPTSAVVSEHLDQLRDLVCGRDPVRPPIAVDLRCARDRQDLAGRSAGAPGPGIVPGRTDLSGHARCHRPPRSGGRADRSAAQPQPVGLRGTDRS